MKKLNTVLLTIVLIGVTQVCFSQEAVQSSSKKIKALFVLKAENKSVQIDNRLGNRIEMDSLFSNDNISSMEVLKDISAVEKYGEAGKEGVIILYLKDYASLPNKTKKLFDLSEK